MAEPLTLREAQAVKELIQKSKNRVLLYHNDPDGITSAALIMKFFPGFDAIPRKGPETDERFVKDIVRRDPDLLLIVDIPIDQEHEKLEAIKKALPHLKIIVIDHHIIERDLNSMGALHINPRFRKPDAYMPCACIVYVMLQKLGFDVRSLVWMAAIGIISDYGIDDCRDVLEECRTEYPYLLRGNPRKSRIFDAAKLISSAVTLKGLKGASEAMKILTKCEYFEDLAAVRKLKEWRNIVDSEIRQVILESEKTRTKKGDVLFYRIDTKLKLNSIIATILSEKHPDSVIVVRQRYRNGWKISLRNQSGKYNLGEIAKRAVRGIGSGGGHEKAAAAMVPRWLEFRRRFLSELSQT